MPDGSRPPTFALADLFELVAEAVPEAEALVCGGADGSRVRRTYAELAARTRATAAALAARGVGPGDGVGVHLHNHAAHVEALLALLWLRAVPVNLNTRYVADELAYVLADAEAVGLLTEPDSAEAAAGAAEQVPSLAWVVVVDDAWRAEVDAAGPPPPRPDRSGDDLLLLYTGGTTGQPKGVMWRQEDLYVAALGGRGTPSRGVPPTLEPADVVARATGTDPIRRRLPFCPLIHGGALWIVLQSLLSGGTAIVSTDRHHDGVAAADLLATEGAELTMVIGDAVARPIADALEAHPGRWDLSALQVVASGGAVLSPAVADQLRRLLPGVKVVDTFGASETGGQGRLVRRPGDGGAPRLLSDEHTAVLGEDLAPVGPGEVGRLARSGRIPLGYWGDEARTAATFPTIDGVRWSVPGDLARLEGDGTITLLGRGSTSINTGGEKVFPEEVEGVLKSHPSVLDALVVGVPDERFGQRVPAVVARRPGPEAAGLGADELVTHARHHLAGYKVPRRVVWVDACQRLATGKPDYGWATRQLDDDPHA